MNALDIILVTLFTLPVLVEQLRSPKPDGFQFFLAMVSVLTLGMTWGLVASGLVVVVILFVMIKDRRMTERWERHPMTRHVRLAMAVASLAATMLDEDCNRDFRDRSDPFVNAVFEMGKALVKTSLEKQQRLSSQVG